MIDGMLLLIGQATEVGGGWSQLLSGLDQGQRFALLVVAIGCATGIILGLAGIVYCAADGIHRRRLYADMKREMIERGMSADEIVRIIEATPPEDATDRDIATSSIFDSLFSSGSSKKSQ